MALIAACSFAGAQGNEYEHSESGDYFERKAEGYFWYEDPVIEQEEEEELQRAPPQAASSGSEVEPMSAEWLRQQLPVLLDKAIDRPTKENVQAYYYAQRMMMDKAQVFSDIAREVVTSDPLLDENLRVPIASAAKASVMLQVKKDTQDILKGLNEKAGIWVFHDPSCSFCEDQVNPINELAKRHGLNIVYISKDGSPVRGLDPSIPVRRADGRFERLGVKYTPSVMMVVPPDGYYLISQGFAGLPTLVWPAGLKIMV